MAPTPASRLRSTTRRLRRAVLVRRRLLAALATGLAVFLALRATAPPPQPSQGVLVATHDVAAGETLSDDDLTVRAAPPDAVPGGFLRGPEEATGRVLAAPLRAGEPVTDLRLVGPGLLEGYPGMVAVPVRVADSAVVDLLEVGDQVDLVAVAPDASRPAEVVAEDVTVVAIPQTPKDLSTALPGGLVLAAMPPDRALVVAQAATTAVITLLISGSQVR